MTRLLDDDTRMGVVSLSVSSLATSLAYYQDHIGLSVLEQNASDATLGVAGLPLLHLHEVPGARLVRRATGLYHFALRVPTRHDLARVILQFSKNRTPVSGASDHLVSEALYLSDPDGHGIEIYRDRPRAEWYDKQGQMQMGTEPMDVNSIVAELRENEEPWTGLPAGTDMGHVHLQIANVAQADEFYLGKVGFSKMFDWPSASFIGAGGYHHHLGMNTWAGVGVPAPPADAARLLSYEIMLPSSASLNATRDQLHAAGVEITEREDGWSVVDPSQNVVIFKERAN
jgi:catechol 2,3-dioxygenase